MSLRLLGISHRTAPIEEREFLAVAPARLPEALAQLGAQAGVREAMILSTCNRVELLVDAVAEGPDPDLLHALAVASARSSLPPAARFYLHRDAEAARHVLRVAASLDSLVLGEPQILGQLKQAYAAAQDADTAGPELDALLPRAFHAAKRVRSETAIAQNPVSVSQTAVDLARQIFGSLENKVVLLMGAGAAGQDAARFLVGAGAQRLLVMNRTLARAEELAAKYRGEALGLDQLEASGDQADIVVTCVGTGQFLVSRAAAVHFLGRRRGRPMLFLDLAVPRDVEPSVHQLENAFVYNVDDLDQVVSANLAGRRQEAERGEAIIEAELRLYLQRREVRDLTPTLAALQEHAESLRAAEWERVRRRLGPLTAEQEQAVEAFSRSLMRKWLHQPLVELKQSASQTGRPSDRDALLELVQRLFALSGRGDKRGA